MLDFHMIFEPTRRFFQEPLLVVGKDRFKDVDIRVRVNGGGHVAQIYAIRQAIAKAIVSFILLLIGLTKVIEYHL